MNRANRFLRARLRKARPPVNFYVAHPIRSASLTAIDIECVIVMQRKVSAALATISLIALSACAPSPKTASTETETKPAQPAPPPEPVPAKTAFWPMYTSARTWTTDFVILKVEAKEVPGFKNENGKAAMWQATFASPSRQEYRTYSYAVAAVPPDIYKGVVIGGPEPWNGTYTRSAMPIQVSEFSIDSDAAYQSAAADAAAWLKKNPEKKLATVELSNSARFQVPTWYFLWGDKKLGYAAFVNATDGKVLKQK
jgi:hypothetical protein